MITISGKNFSFQATHMKAGSSITISSSGGIKFNNVALEAKMQSAEKIDQNQSNKGSNAGYSNNVPSRSDTKDIKPEVTRGKPFPGGEPPRVVEPLPKAPEVINLVPAEGIVLGDALDPPNGEFQVLDSRPKAEPKGNIPRDIVRVPSLDDTKFIETDLSRRLAAEEAGGFDQELISLTGLQPEVASSAPLEAPKGIVLGDALPPPPGGFQILQTAKPAESGKLEFEIPEQIVLGDALPPPPGGFQILQTAKPTAIPTNLPAVEELPPAKPLAVEIPNGSGQNSGKKIFNFTVSNGQGNSTNQSNGQRPGESVRINSLFASLHRDLGIKK